MNLTPRISVLHMPAHQSFALRSIRVVKVYGYYLDCDIKDKIIMLNETCCCDIVTHVKSAFLFVKFEHNQQVFIKLNY